MTDRPYKSWNDLQEELEQIRREKINLARTNGRGCPDRVGKIYDKSKSVEWNHEEARVRMKKYYDKIKDRRKELEERQDEVTADICHHIKELSGGVLNDQQALMIWNRSTKVYDPASLAVPSIVENNIKFALSLLESEKHVEE